MLNRLQLQAILNKKYQRANWIELIRNITNEPDLLTNPFTLELDKSIAKNGYELGTFETTDGMLIGLFEIELNENIQIERNKVGVRNLLRKYYKQVDGCFAVYKLNNKWRFSYISETSSKDEIGNRIDNKTEPKRFTYVLGEGETVRTAVDRFDILLKSEKLLNDIKDAFSVEKVTKDFFTEIALQFTRLSGGDRTVSGSIKSFKPLLKLPSFTDKTTLQEFAVRLIGRIVFCWFLNKKVSRNGLPLIPSEILSSNAVIKNQNYYHSVLEKLFFEALNTKSEERSTDYQKGFYKDVPFLNGGLFEPNEDDFYVPSLVNTLLIPNSWFLELFGTLENFNFTIDENTSIDIELSVDPEMLGRIFENLLAEINPETGETARKSTGSYYTPRAIVEYMVDESLMIYLKSKTEIGEEKLRLLMAYSNEQTSLTQPEKKNLLNAIDNVKILDPACGSGAFPIGILQKMLLILQKIDPKSELWFEKMIGNIEDNTLKEQIKNKFKNENLNFIRKFGLIQKCIYGVDVQTIAVELSKLRCFLTLVVEEEIDDKKYNRGIIPLPNLEFKFVAATTLIGLEEETHRISLFDESKHIKKLEDLRNDYFVASGVQKDKIEIDFIDEQIKIAGLISQRRDYSGRSLQLSTWEPFTHKLSSWFDSKWMFGIIEGFDIIIGNPPWIFTRKGDFTIEFKKYIKNKYLKHLIGSQKGRAKQSGKINVFAIFILYALNAMKKDGVLSFIVPNTILRATVFDSVRKSILDKTTLRTIVDLSSGIFAEVTASTIIIMLQNSILEPEVKTLHSIAIEKGVAKNTVSYIKQNDIYKNISYTFNIFATADSSKLNSKINNETKRLDVCFEILAGGIATGPGKSKYISDYPKSSKYKPLLEGKDIKRFATHFNNRYIMYDRNKLYRARDEEIFLKDEKLITQRIGGGLKPLVVAYDNKKYYTFNSTNIIYSKPTSTVSIKYLLGLLNSSLLNWYYSSNFSNSSTLTVNISKTFLEQLPIKLPSDNIQEKIINMVNGIIKNKEKRLATQDLENQLDIAVYKIYELTYEEATIVDSKIEKVISRKEYERFKIQ